MTHEEIITTLKMLKKKHANDWTTEGNRINLSLSVAIEAVERKEYKNMKELKDTVSGMNSADYKERFIAEYQQTKIRYEKLKAFCNKIEVAEMMGTEPPKHDCPLELLREQQKHMGMYLYVLEKRALIENVTLE